MITFERIYQAYTDEGLYLNVTFNQPMDAAIIELRGSYGVFLDALQYKTQMDMKAAMMHEYGHGATGATHKLYSPHQIVEKHEFTANKKAATTFLPPEAFEEAFAYGFREAWELAEWFGIPEERVVWAWEYYAQNGLL